MTVVVACGGSPGAESTTVTAATTTATAATTTSTTVAATTTTEAPGLEGEELLACLVGSWTLDTDTLVAGIYALGFLADDPEKEDFVLLRVSGGGDLTVASDQTITVAFDNLTITYQYPNRPTPLPPGVIIEGKDVYSGSATAVFEVNRNLVSVADTSGAGLEIRGWYRQQGAQSSQEYSGLLVHPGAVVLGLDVRPPREPTDAIAIDCDADRLVVKTLFDPISVDAPEAVWLRDQPEETP